MSSTIKYKSTLGTFITREQALSLSDFSKLFFENNQLKKEEIYKNNKLWEGAYFLDEGQDYTSVLPEIDASQRWRFLSNKTTVNNHSVWEERYYIAGQLRSTFSKEVFDADNRLIASQGFDENGVAIPGVVKKFHFGGQPIVVDQEAQGTFPEGSEISFYYDQDGSVEIIPDTGGYDEPIRSIAYFVADGIDNPIIYLMTPAQLEYYTHPEPLIPNF